MKLLQASAAVFALSFSASALASDNGWSNDNGVNNKSGSYDPVDVTNSSGALVGDSLHVTLPVGDLADYARLCDAVAKVKLVNSDGSASQVEYFHIQRRLIKANRNWEADVLFDAADAGNGGSFHFIKASTRFDMTCLRYDLPGPVDPVANPGQRPSQIPSQVCNPEKDPRGCDNTCDGAGVSSCLPSPATGSVPSSTGTGTGWDANAQYWK